MQGSAAHSQAKLLLMSTPQSKTTIAATFTLKNDAGEVEEAQGQFVISDDEPNHLIHLFSDFASEQPNLEAIFEQHSEVESYPLLHARTEKGSFAFVDSKLVGYSRSHGGGKLSRRSYRPHLVIQTHLILNEDELYLTHATFRLWGQDLWADWTNWSLETEIGPDADLKLTRVHIPEQTASYQNVLITLKDASPMLFGPRLGATVTLRQTSLFKLEFPEPIGLQDFVKDWLSPIRFLVSSGIRSAAGVETLRIGNSTWTDDGTGELIKLDLQVLVNNPERKVPEEGLDEQKFLHSRPRFDLPVQLPIFFEAWEKHRVTFEQYLDWIQRRPRSKLTQMSYMAQLVETFDRSLSPDPGVSGALESLADTADALFASTPELEPLRGKARQAVLESTRPTLSQRLKRLDGETGKLVSKALKSGTWKGDVPLIRNSLVHGLPSSEFFATNHIPLYVSVDILELLFEARFLVVLGFTPAEATKMIVEDNPRWFQRLSAIVDYMGSFKDFRDFVPTIEAEAEANAESTPEPADTE